MKIKKIRRFHNTKTGFYGVTQRKCKYCKNGFTWIYETMNNNGEYKYYSNVNFLKLKDMVKKEHLKWDVTNINYALKTSKIVGIPVYYLK